MFGSLVIFFPTPHEGGVVHIRHKGEEWTFDPAAITAAQESPSVAFIALNSDAEREITVVNSGYCVTITYNLYFDNDKTSATPQIGVNEGVALHKCLSTLLDNTGFLPDGGYLGFGLRYMYPITTNAESYSLHEVINSLKGSDAVIKRVLDQLNLSPKLKILYEVEDYVDDGLTLQVMLDSVASFPEEQSDISLKDALSEAAGAVVLRETDEDHGVTDCYGTIIPSKRIHWVTPLTNFTRITSQYVTFGNDASLLYTYGDVCLVVEIPVSGKRLKRKRGGSESEDD